MVLAAIAAAPAFAQKNPWREAYFSLFSQIIESNPTPPVEENPTPPIEQDPTPPTEENPTPPTEENPTPPIEEHPTPPMRNQSMRPGDSSGVTHAALLWTVVDMKKDWKMIFPFERK